jgi:SAM-dependent methyltransferase
MPNPILEPFHALRRAWSRARATPEPFMPEEDIRMRFWHAMWANPPRRVIEVGTRQWVPGKPTRHYTMFHEPRPEYIGFDVIDGPDVDRVGDLHALPPEWTDYFDSFIAIAVFEHLERPWIAAREMARALAPGGRFFISTHQCYPVHGFPNDFFRFSKEALRLLLEDAGLEVEACGYEHRCMIVPPHSVIPMWEMQRWNRHEPSYLLVNAMGRKP